MQGQKGKKRLESAGRDDFDLQFRNACGRFEIAFSQEGS
jgi:hypothetical protein